MKGKIITAGMVAALFMFSAQTVTAGPVTITAPTVSGTAQDSNVNAAIATVAQEIQNEANTELEKYDGEQKKLAEGFANANAYSAQSATLQGYQGYSLFALSGGLLVGAQLPSLDPATLSEIPDTIADDPDVYAGLATSVSFVNIGFNAEKVFGFFNRDLGKKLKHFYFNVKFGGLSQSFGTGDNALDISSMNVGLGVNYQFLPSIGVLGGFARWRGINFGSGLLYQSNTIDFTTKLDKITQSATSGTADVTMSVTPNVGISAKMNTVTIPLEATTSVQLLWLLNLNFGVGADLVFGSSELKATSSSPVSIDSIKVGGTTVPSYSSTPGYITVDTGTDGAPDILRARVMTGFGFNFGPLKIDVPVYYYLKTGLAFGVTAGIVW